ncbi:MAG TPA: LamB/YcsF family protein [Labilithrix sp.]|nr:LamB/YcsF family protein [Labilithrix sp.]
MSAPSPGTEGAVPTKEFKVLLNLDGGEHDDEPEELYALADVVHIACGGHAGDDVSMARVVEACSRLGTRIGAHPSYVDREGFGRRPVEVNPETLARQIETQCAALAAIASNHGKAIVSVKPHGALYHAAHADPVVAHACVEGVRRALGHVALVGLAGGALESEAKARGYTYLREAFADRGVRPDGTLVPRGEPGAILGDPRAAAARARALVADRQAETICIHADTPAALALARAVREALDS